MTNIEEAMKKQAEQRRREAEAAEEAKSKNGEDREAEQPDEAQAAEEPEVISGSSASPARYSGRSAKPARIDRRVVSFYHPNSEITENFKQFHTLLRNLSEESTATLAFASAQHGEGRTTMTVNFAVALAGDAPGNVCLVDADLRRPGVHKVLDLHPTQGLGDALSNDIPLDEIITPTNVPRLSVVCAGNVGDRPSELLRTPRFGTIVSELREKFDYVIFDTAPVLPVADTILLTSHVDGVVLVLKAGKTKRKSVTRALELLGHASMMGFVLNEAAVSSR